MVDAADDSPSSWSWFEDDPLTDPDTDPRNRYFEHDAFTAAVSDIIDRSHRSNSSSTTFALIGPWGSGKTTVLATVQKDLVTREWSVQHFNPWYYPDGASLTWGFFDALRDALPKANRWTDTRKALDGLRIVVTPIAKLGAIFGLDVSGVAAELLSKDRVNAVTVRDNVAKKLDTLPHPVLMILDDLDRLTAAELLETFKLVRFIGRLPNVYYLLCYDEQTLTDMLNKTDLVGELGDRRALDYLEKIVQVRFDLPPVREDLAEELVYTSVLGLLSSATIPVTFESERRLQRLISDPLCKRLRTPRAVKHFMAQLEAFLPKMAPEVDWVDFVLLTWLRCFEPALYSTLQHEKYRFTRAPSSAALGDSHLNADRAWFTKTLEEWKIRPQYRDDVTAVLMELFPTVSNWISNAYGRSESAAGRIANRDYFDRFFAFGVPADDLPDLTVRDAIQHLGNAADASVARVYDQLRAAPRRTVLKINRESQDAEAALAVTKWLLRIIDTLPNTNGWPSPFNQASWLAAFTLERIHEREYIDLVSALDPSQPKSAYLLADAAETLLARKTGTAEEVRQWNHKGRKLADQLLPRLPEILDANATDDVYSSDDVFSIFRPWQSLDPDGPRNYIHRKVASGSWSEFDVLSRFVNVGYAHDIETDVGTIVGLDTNWADRFVDVERALLDVPSDAPPPLPQFDSFLDVPATRTNRRAFLLWFRDHRPPQSVV